MIGFFELRPAERDFLHDEFGDNHIYSEQPISQVSQYTLADLDTACVFVNSDVDQEIITMLESCDHIATRSTGTDHIDVDAADGQGIVVSRVPSYGPHTIAEFAFGLLLSVTRKVADAYHQQRSHDTFSLTDFRGIDLRGKSIGIVGTGDIGAHVARIADGFGMEIYAYDVKQSDELAEKYGVRYVKSLQDMLPKLDVLTLHIPHTKETHNIIDRAEIDALPDTAYLINTARGGLVNTKALAQALEAGSLSGAGLDVLTQEGRLRTGQELNDDAAAEESEEILADYKLIRSQNAVVTPHIAFYTEESEQEILQTTSENIRSFRQNGEPVYTA